MIRSNGVTESIRKEGRRMFCLATIDVFSRVSLPYATCTHTHTPTHTHVHTSGGESIRATSLGFFQGS